MQTARHAKARLMPTLKAGEMPGKSVDDSVDGLWKMSG
jgi:hypothetical protein